MNVKSLESKWDTPSMTPPCSPTHCIASHTHSFKSHVELSKEPHLPHAELKGKKLIAAQYGSIEVVYGQSLGAVYFREVMNLDCIKSVMALFFLLIVWKVGVVVSMLHESHVAVSIISFLSGILSCICWIGVMNKDVVYIMRKNFTIYYQEFEFLLMTIAMMDLFSWDHRILTALPYPIYGMCVGFNDASPPYFRSYGFIVHAAGVLGAIVIMVVLELSVSSSAILKQNQYSLGNRGVQVTNADIVIQTCVTMSLFCTAKAARALRHPNRLQDFTSPVEVVDLEAYQRWVANERTKQQEGQLDDSFIDLESF